MRSRSAQRKVAGAAAALLMEVALAAPAAAQGVLGTGSGRTGATVALIVAGIGVVTGALALSRSAARNARDLAIAALVLGTIGVGLAGLHLATTTGGFYGTGNGRGGAVLGVVLGLIGMVLGRLARARTTAVTTTKETRSHG